MSDTLLTILKQPNWAGDIAAVLPFAFVSAQLEIAAHRRCGPGGHSIQSPMRGG